uniref:G_PROTEIN_RECEP_F1_2 domain-containing protein n=1 Tax=Steinernema glaseri TaxID=37863 RepID=A0A1I7ZYA1_9BILA
MSDWLTSLYNIVLNVTSVGSITVKTTAAYLIICHTPKNMRYVSHFILNELVWNFSANLLCIFGHPLPMMPEECFRLDGLLGDLFPDEVAGHLVFLFTMMCAMNCAIALMLGFQFRYLSLAYKHRIRNIRPLWGYIYCTGVHTSATCIYIFFYLFWAIPLSEYPHKDARTPRMFCFRQSGLNKTLTIFSFSGSILGTLAILVIFYVLCFRHLRKNEVFLDRRTLRMQETLLRNLMVLALVPTLIGFVPLITGTILVYLNETAYAREICALCMAIVLNHGTVYGIVTIMIFKAYRNAFRKILTHVASKIPYQNNNQTKPSKICIVPVYAVRNAIVCRFLSMFFIAVVVELYGVAVTVYGVATIMLFNSYRNAFERFCTYLNRKMRFWKDPQSTIGFKSACYRKELEDYIHALNCT